MEAVATVLDDSETEAVYQAINKRYGIVGRIFNFFSKLRGGAKAAPSAWRSGPPDPRSHRSSATSI